jgi:hypothetical protein
MSSYLAVRPVTNTVRSPPGKAGFCISKLFAVGHSLLLDQLQKRPHAASQTCATLQRAKQFDGDGRELREHFLNECE